MRFACLAGCLNVARHAPDTMRKKLGRGAVSQSGRFEAFRRSASTPNRGLSLRP